MPDSFGFAMSGDTPPPEKKKSSHRKKRKPSADVKAELGNPKKQPDGFQWGGRAPW